MSLTGTLSEFSPVEIIHIIGALEKSGKLSFSLEDDRGLIVFRRGKIVYAASAGFRENLGSMLLARGLITEIELVDALGVQTLANKDRRLGAILTEMGALSQEDLERVMLEQVVRAVSAFSNWSTGDFEFSSVHIEDRGEVELETEDLWTSLGHSPTHVLQRVSNQMDQGESRRSAGTIAPDTPAASEPGATDSLRASEPEIQEPSETGSLDDFVDEVRGPQAKGELIQRLLEQAGEIFGTSVVFSVGHDRFQLIAQTDTSLSQPSGVRALLDLVLERHAPSLLSRCADAGQTVMVELPGEEGDQVIVGALGGPSEGRLVAIPMLVRGETLLILLGLDLLEELRTGWLENLESFVDKAGRAIEADIHAEITAQTFGA